VVDFVSEAITNALRRSRWGGKKKRREKKGMKEMGEQSCFGDNQLKVGPQSNENLGPPKVSYC